MIKNIVINNNAKLYYKKLLAFVQMILKVNIVIG